MSITTRGSKLLDDTIFKGCIAVGAGAVAFAVAIGLTGGFGVVEERRVWCADHGAVLEQGRFQPLPRMCLDAERRLLKPPM